MVVARLSQLSQLSQLSRRGRIGLAVALVVAVGAGGVLVARSGGERSVEATVQGFFEARRDGDCERLLDYLHEPSWSEGDRLGRREFLTHCEEAVDGYRPELAGVEVVSETGDAAVVQMATPVAGDAPLPRPGVGDRPQGLVVRAPQLTDDEQAGLGIDAAYEQGQLVRDGSTWRVRLDPRFLRIGRSVEQTVIGYLRAYREGECEEAAGFVSDDAWTGDTADAGGDRAGRRGFVERCEAVAELTAGSRRSLPDDPTVETSLNEPQLVALPVAIDLTSTHRDRVTAEVRWSGDLAQAVRLVRRDLTWELTDPSLDVVRLADLSAGLLREPDLGLARAALTPVRPLLPSDPYGLGPGEGTDAAERRHEHGFEVGLTTRFGGHPRRVDLLVYEFADAAGARGYAGHFGGRIAEDATRHQEVAPVDVPGIEGSLAVVTECAGPSLRPASYPVDCGRANKAAAVGARGRFVVAVELTDYRDPDPPADQLVGRAMNVLRTQLDRL
jgi:hypothetical protein